MYPRGWKDLISHAWPLRFFSLLSSSRARVASSLPGASLWPWNEFIGDEIAHAGRGGLRVLPESIKIRSSSSVRRGQIEIPIMEIRDTADVHGVLRYFGSSARAQDRNRALLLLRVPARRAVDNYSQLGFFLRTNVHSRHCDGDFYDNSFCALQLFAVYLLSR